MFYLLISGSFRRDLKGNIREVKKAHFCCTIVRTSTVELNQNIIQCTGTEGSAVYHVVLDLNHVQVWNCTRVGQ